MNLEQVELKTLEVERFHLREALRCLLHTILFHRALGTATVPKDVDSEVFDGLTYVRVDEASIARHVENTVEKFAQSLEKTGETNGTMNLSFYVKQLKKGWISSKEEKVFWERWVIPVSLYKEKATTQTDRDRRQARTLQQLRERQLLIVQAVNEKREHLPPVTKHVTCFPYELSFGSDADKAAGTWGLDTFTRMLQKGPPLLMN